MQAIPLPPSFLNTYSLSTSSLGCKALYIVISFLVLWSICWSYSFVDLKNGPEYLTRAIAQVFILLMRFLLRILLSSNFLVLLRNYFLFLISSLHIWWCPLPIFPSICKFPFLRAFWFFLDLVVLFSLSFIVFRFTWSAWLIFLCQNPSLYLLCISLLLVLGFPVLFHFWQTVWYRPYILDGCFFLVI